MPTNSNTMELVAGETVMHKNQAYKISDETPTNGDLVVTEKYGVWEFKDKTGKGSAPMPYWANKNTCKKLVHIVE